MPHTERRRSLIYFFSFGAKELLKMQKSSLQSKDYVVELWGDTVNIKGRRHNEKGKKDISWLFWFELQLKRMKNNRGTA